MVLSHSVRRAQRVDIMKQLLITAEPDSGGYVQLSGKDFHYMVRVRRARVGDTFTLRTQVGAQYSAVVSALDIHTRSLILHCTPMPPVDEKTQVTLVLLQWMPRARVFDAIVRHATELGTARIIPIRGERSLIRDEKDTQHARLQRIVREARQQSGSAVNTRVDTLHSLLGALHMLEQEFPYPSAVRIYCSEKHVGGSFHELLWTGRSTHCTAHRTPTEPNAPHNTPDVRAQAVILAVGAEGGFSDTEERTLHDAHFAPLHFRTNVLRVETAALYALAGAHLLLSEAALWNKRSW